MHAMGLLIKGTLLLFLNTKNPVSVNVFGNSKHQANEIVSIEILRGKGV